MRCLHTELADKTPTSVDKSEGRDQVEREESSFVEDVREVGAMGEGQGGGCGVWRVVQRLRRNKKRKNQENAVTPTEKTDECIISSSGKG